MTGLLRGRRPRRPCTARPAPRPGRPRCARRPRQRAAVAVERAPPRPGRRPAWRVERAQLGQLGQQRAPPRPGRRPARGAAGPPARARPGWPRTAASSSPVQLGQLRAAARRRCASSCGPQHRLARCRRRLRSAVSISTSWRRRATSAASSRVAASGSGRAGGPHRLGEARQHRRVQRVGLGQLPGRAAKSRTWRGLTTATGSPAAASAAGRRPPRTRRWPPAPPAPAPSAAQPRRPARRCPAGSLATRQASPARPHRHVQVRLGHVDPDEHARRLRRAIRSSARAPPDAARPCLMRARGPGNRAGSGGGRARRRRASGRPRTAQGLAACRARVAPGPPPAAAGPPPRYKGLRRPQTREFQPGYAAHRISEDNRS